VGLYMQSFIHYFKFDSLSVYSNKD
jgi:hypothetical protein